METHQVRSKSPLEFVAAKPYPFTCHLCRFGSGTGATHRSCDFCSSAMSIGGTNLQPTRFLTTFEIYDKRCFFGWPKFGTLLTKIISFGGIPNSSRLITPCLITCAHSRSAVVLPIWTMSPPKGIQKQSHSCSCQSCKATNHTGTLLSLPKHWNSPEPSGTFRKLPPETTPPHNRTRRNLSEVVSETSPAHTRTLRNLPEPVSATHTSTHQNSPEPASRTHTSTPHGTFRNLPLEPIPAPELRNLPPEPTPAHARTLRNLLEPFSGTCSSDLRLHTVDEASTTDSGSHSNKNTTKSSTTRHGLRLPQSLETQAREQLTGSPRIGGGKQSKTATSIATADLMVLGSYVLDGIRTEMTFARDPINAAYEIIGKEIRQKELLGST